MDNVKIKYSILPSFSGGYGPIKNGNLHPNLSASRYDWLRIAKAIMDDYQNDTCVGKYLKEIHKRRIPKNYGGHTKANQNLIVPNPMGVNFIWIIQG